MFSRVSGPRSIFKQCQLSQHVLPSYLRDLWDSWTCLQVIIMFCQCFKAIGDVVGDFSHPCLWKKYYSSWCVEPVKLKKAARRDTVYIYIYIHTYFASSTQTFCCSPFQHALNLDCVYIYIYSIFILISMVGIQEKIQHYRFCSKILVIFDC